MRIYPLVALTLISSACLFADSVLKGSIADSEGASIAGVTIFIHWDPSGSTVGLSSNVGIKEDRVIRTDSNGRFSVNLPPGFYDVLVSSPAFTPVCGKVRTREGSSVTFDSRLQVNGLVIDELGFKIEAIPPKSPANSK